MQTCPGCSTTMRQKLFLGVNLDVCPKCAGIWCNCDELNALLARDPQAFAEVDQAVAPEVKHTAGGPSARVCPDCKVILDQYHYMYTSPVILDACRKCGGFWVEDGELLKMQQVLDQSRRPPMPTEEAGILLGQAAGEHAAEMMDETR